MHKKARGPLLQNLTPSEKVLAWISGNSHQTMVLTSHRVIVIKPGLMAGAMLGAKISSFPLSEIASFEFAKHLGTSFLMIRTAGSPMVNPTVQGPSSGYSLPNVVPINDDKQAQIFANSVNQIIRQDRESLRQSVAPPLSVADELAKLAALRDSGILSDVEFSAQKIKLLG
jgi:hypothetical protein